MVDSISLTPARARAIHEVLVPEAGPGVDYHDIDDDCGRFDRDGDLLGIRLGELTGARVSRGTHNDGQIHFVNDRGDLIETLDVYARHRSEGSPNTCRITTPRAAVVIAALFGTDEFGSTYRLPHQYPQNPPFSLMGSRLYYDQVVALRRALGATNEDISQPAQFEEEPVAAPVASNEAEPSEPIVPASSTSWRCGLSLGAEQLFGNFEGDYPNHDGPHFTSLSGFMSQIGIGVSCLRRTGVVLEGGIMPHYSLMEAFSEPYIIPGGGGNFSYFAPIRHGVGGNIHASIGYPFLDYLDVFARLDVGGGAGFGNTTDPYVTFEGTGGIRFTAPWSERNVFFAELAAGYGGLFYLGPSFLGQAHGIVIHLEGTFRFW